MSTSKGRGTAAHTIADVVPPEQLRFMFLRPRPNQAIEFVPEGTDAVPRVFDEFDRFAAATAGRPVKGEIAPGYEATFRYSLLDPNADVTAEAWLFRPAFAHLALLVQIPGVDVAGRVEAEKGDPLTERETAILDERVAAARAWLEAFAPDSARVAVHEAGVPDAATELDDRQRRFLAALATSVEGEASGRRRCLAVAHLHPRQGGRPAGTRGLRSHLSRLPRPAQRAARRLAAGQPGSGLRRGPGEGRRSDGLGRDRVMSVGLQRLREEPDVIRDGAVRKGEDPALVDRALALDADRRRLLAESESLKAERNAASKRIGEAIKSGAAPDGPEVADLRAASSAAGTRITTLDAELAQTESELDDLLLRIPNPPDPDIPVGGEEANVTIRTWGEVLPHDQPLVGEVGADAPAGGETWPRRPHWELGEALGILDLARGAKISGSGLPGLQGRRLGAPARADQLVPRRPHPRERDDRGLAAGRRQHGQRDGHRPDPGQGRPDVRRDPRRAVPGPDRRGPGHEPAPRRDPRGDRAADPLRRVYPVLPARGRRGRQGHPRDPARPPVRQGRDGPVRASGRVRRRARVDDRPRRDPAPASRPGLPGPAHEHPRDGLHPGAQVRPRGLVAGRGALARGQLVLQLRRLPGTPDGDPLPAGARGEAGARPHAQRIRAGPRPHRRGDPRDLPATGRHDRGAGGPAPVPGSRHDRPA